LRKIPVSRTVKCPSTLKQLGIFASPLNRYFSQITLTNRIYLYTMDWPYWILSVKVMSNTLWLIITTVLNVSTYIITSITAFPIGLSLILGIMSVSTFKMHIILYISWLYILLVEITTDLPQTRYTTPRKYKIKNLKVYN
jgi:hypothetical protein